MSLKSILHPAVVSVKTFMDTKKQKKYMETSYPEKIRTFKNINRGKRCFIIGNGPSLKISDLAKLQDEDCFACNRIYGVYDKTSWRPKYYCAQDYKVLQQISEDLPQVIKESDAAFLPYNFKEMYPERMLTDDKVNLFYHPYVSVYSEDGTYLEDIMPFSNDITKSIYDGLSITYGMIQIAVYMGYTRIYLLGIDHNYKMNNGVVDASQSYAEGIKVIDMSTQFPPELALCENSFRTAKRFCERNGIRIQNATRGGKLEVFDRVDFEKVVESDE